MTQNKLSLLSAYNTLHKYDVICISEIYLDKLADNDALSIDGYNIIRTDHPHNQKGGGVRIYFKENLKLKQIITSNFSECILCEISMKNRIRYIAVTYRSPVKQLVNLIFFWKILKNHLLEIYLVILMLDLNHGGMRT